MFVIRPITEEDLDTLESFAFSTSLGMVSMPRKRHLLESKIQDSLQAFRSDITSPKKETYLFILEDSATEEKGGSCGIYSKTGVEDPLYFYRVETSKNQKVLRPVIYRNGPSELCGLFLSKKFRHGGLGKLLSLSRLLFIASHPQRFDDTLMAQLRGVIKKRSQSAPFWEGVGRHFLPLPFYEAIGRLDEGKDFIAEFLPEFPIYISLLTKEVQKTIGATFNTTRPAFNMLTEQGFYYTQEVDLFDAGPRLIAKRENINTIQESCVSTISSIEKTDLTSGSLMLISNTRLDFRCCIAKAKKGLVVDAQTAQALQVDIGEEVRYVPLNLRGKK